MLKVAQRIGRDRAGDHAGTARTRADASAYPLTWPGAGPGEFLATGCARRCARRPCKAIHRVISGGRALDHRTESIRDIEQAGEMGDALPR